MSYNGIGLSTPRGSGTNGYVMRNLSHVKKRAEPYSREKQMSDAHKPREKQRKADRTILEHERKRQIELRVLELREKLEEEETLNDQEIDEKCESLQRKLKEKLAQDMLDDYVDSKALKPHQVHDLAERKRVELERIRDALGLPETVEPEE